MTQQRHTSGWLAIARGCAGYLALVHFIGFAMFPREPQIDLTNAYFVMTFAALILFAILPTRLVLRFRVPLAAIAAAAIVLTCLQVPRDLTLSGGADYPAAAMRLVVCALVMVLSAQSFNSVSKTN